MEPASRPRRSLGQLPDDLLLRVLRATGSVKERHKAQLPLVSRRWRDLLHSSELLSSVSINLCLSNARASAALQSLFAWLAGWAAGRVRHLELALECPGLGYGALGALMQGEAGMEMDEAEEALWASLRACGAGGQLRQLSLALDSMLYASPQALGPNLLSSLQRLCLDASLPGQDPPGYDDGPANLTLVACGLEAATALTELKLSGGPLGIAGGLPPSLTKLGVSGYTAEGNLGEAQCLPCQLNTLAQLRSLCLEGVQSLSPADYSALASLPHLERLSLVCCSHVPACLPALTTLHTLHLHNTPHMYGPGDREGAATLGAALAELTGLSHLALHHIATLPPQLAGVTQLRRFLWQRPPFLPPSASNAAASSQLPLGPWLSGLQQLGLDADMAAASLAALAAAQQLEALCVQTHPQAGALARVAEAASRHPTLRTLGLALPPLLPSDDGATWRSVVSRLEALRLRPTLRVEPDGGLMRALNFTDQLGRLDF